MMKVKILIKMKMNKIKEKKREKTKEKNRKQLGSLRMIQMIIIAITTKVVVKCWQQEILQSIQLRKI